MFAVLLVFGLTIATVASQECASNQFKISQNGQDYIVVDSVTNTVNVTGTLKTGQIFLNGVDIAATLASLTNAISALQTQVAVLNQTQIQFAQQAVTDQAIMNSFNLTVQSVSAQVNLINQTQVQHSQLINADQAAINNFNTTVQTVSSQVSALSNNVTVIVNQQSQQGSQIAAINATNFGSASWCLDLVNKAEIEAHTSVNPASIPVRWAIGAENYDPTGVFKMGSAANTTINITKRGIVDLDLSFDVISQPKASSAGASYLYVTITFKTNSWFCLARTDYSSWDGLFCQRSFLANPGDQVLISLSAAFISQIDTGPFWSRACLRFQPLY